MKDVLIRLLDPSDSLDVLTALLHRAYAPLAAAGLSFTATDQSVELTAKRVATGACFVAACAGALLGTVTVRGFYDQVTEPWAKQTSWFVRHDAAWLQQLAVEPSWQRGGLGGRLSEAAEAWARERGRDYIVLDTACPATHLREYYQRRGYREVDEVQWEGKRYRSAVLAKSLVRLPPPTQADRNDLQCA